jgi:enediyne biosynthesis protein E4
MVRMLCGAAALLAALAVGAASCGSSTVLCAPGRAVSCACPGGGHGIQTCVADGSGFDTCDFCGAPRAGFEDVTHPLGLPEHAGPCVGFEDFDGDGKLDLLLSTMFAGGPMPGGALSELRIYPGDGHGGFGAPTKVSEGFLTLCQVGDLDRDGRADIALAAMGTAQGTEVQVWRNLGGLRFAKGTVGDPFMTETRVYALGLWDYDDDGWLDVLVGRNFGAPFVSDADCYFTGDDDFACHAAMKPNNPAPRVFHNDHGAFAAVDPAGLLAPPYAGVTNAVAFADINGDGRSDVFMSEDFYVNHLHWRRAGSGYEHGEQLCGIDQYNHGMGAAIADYDGDGLLDIYSVDLGPNKLWLNTKSGWMPNRALQWGVAAATRHHSNWAPLGEDFDLDGWTDVFVTSAGVVENDAQMPALGRAQTSALVGVPQYDLVMWNESGSRFTSQRLAHRPGQTPAVVLGASATADVDGDGDLDVVVGTGVPLQFRLLRNQQNAGNWLVVDLEGTTSNKDGIGAEVRITVGGALQRRTVGSQGSLGSSWRRAHFGLGAAHAVDALEVRWPSGKKQTLGALTANQTVQVTEQ